MKVSLQIEEYDPNFKIPTQPKAAGERCDCNQQFLPNWNLPCCNTKPTDCENCLARPFKTLKKGKKPSCQECGNPLSDPTISLILSNS